MAIQLVEEEYVNGKGWHLRIFVDIYASLSLKLSSMA
jgi:hypothetical protein